MRVERNRASGHDACGNVQSSVVAPKIDALRQAWLDAPDMETERRVVHDLQMQFWQDVPDIPMGEWTQYTCYSRSIVDVPMGFPLFYGVRPA